MRPKWISFLSMLTIAAWLSVPPDARADDFAVVPPTDPDSLELDVDTTANIIIEFDHAMDLSTFTGGSGGTFEVDMADPGARYWDGTFSYDGDSTKIKFDPTDDFNSGRWIWVLLKKGLKAANGDSLFPPYQFRFRTVNVPDPDPCWDNDTIWGGSNFENRHLFPENDYDQSEVCIAVAPGAADIVLVGSNWSGGSEHQASYFWDDGDTTWIRDTVANSESWHSRDPAVAFDTAGNAFYSFFTQPDFGDAYLKVSKKSADEYDWSMARQVASGAVDKPHLAVDVFSGSSYTDNIYVAWTDFSAAGSVMLSQTTTALTNFSDPYDISDSIAVSGGANFGVNLAVDPDGDVYAVWSILDSGKATASTAIGFNSSTDGGDTWGDASRIISNVDGILQLDTKTSGHTPGR